MKTCDIFTSSFVDKINTAKNYNIASPCEMW